MTRRVRHQTGDYYFREVLTQGIGESLHTIRGQWRLSLREVEERGLRFAQEWGNQSYRISAGCLQRLERGKHELTVNKLIVLAAIYNVSPEQLLRSIYPGGPQPMLLSQLSSPNATMLLTEGSLEEQGTFTNGEPNLAAIAKGLKEHIEANIWTKAIVLVIRSAGWAQSAG